MKTFLLASHLPNGHTSQLLYFDNKYETSALRGFMAHGTLLVSRQYQPLTIILGIG